MTRGEAVNWLINITADIGKAEHSELWHYEQALSEIREILESELERKTGKWIAAKYPFSQCSICECYFDTANNIGNFCPNCGSYNGGEQE